MVQVRITRFRKYVIFVSFAGIAFVSISMYAGQVDRLQQPFFICPQNVRHLHLVKKCAELKQYVPNPTGTRLIIDHSKKLVQCVVPKAASSTWDYIMTSSGKSDPRDTANSQHLPHLTVARGQLKRTKKAVVQQISGVKGWPEGYPELLNYTRLIVIRHPFTRLLASYRLITSASDDVTTTSQKHPVGPLYTRPYFNEAHKLQNNFTKLTFVMFLQSVLNKDSMIISNDMHWRPYTLSCNPCGVHYDHIIKTETMSSIGSSDAAAVLKQLGYIDTNTNSLRLNSRIGTNETRSRSSDGSSCWHRIPEFTHVPEGLYRKLYKRYFLDMELFGYQFDRKTSVAYCDLKLNNEQLCC